MEKHYGTHQNNSALFPQNTSASKPTDIKIGDDSHAPTLKKKSSELAASEATVLPDTSLLGGVLFPVRDLGEMDPVHLFFMLWEATMDLNAEVLDEAYNKDDFGP